MAKDFSAMEDSNRSLNRSIHDVIETSSPCLIGICHGAIGRMRCIDHV
jgi:hypothetical protein